MRWPVIVIFCALWSVAGLSCVDKPKHPDNLSSGVIDISADETYRSVIDEEKKVFDSSFPDARITIHYKPEAECFKDYFDNKARIILVTRDLTKAEKDLCEQKQVYATSVAIARDAVTLVVNNDCADSQLSVQAVKGILTGTYKTPYTVVFDNQSSSIVRYVTDSLLGGQKLGSNVFSAKGSNAVIDYVTKNPKAIGFVGLGDVGDSTDPNNTGAFIKNVRVVGLYNDTVKDYLKPYLAYIGLKQYPFIRKLFYVNRESYPGLGTGFANFLLSPRGQLIFAHAHLYPLNMEITIRDASIKEQQ